MGDGMKEKKGISNKLLGYNIRLIHPELNELTKSLLTNCNTHRKVDIPKYKLHTEVVLTNLLRCKNKESIYYSRDKFTKCVKTRYNKRKLSTQMLIKVIDILEEASILINTIGKASKKKENRMASFIQPTDMFLDTFSCLDVVSNSVEEQYLNQEECIVLRDEHKDLINFRDTYYTQTARAVVIGLNSILRQFTFKDKDNEIITNHYCRIYNESFDKGGRFYRAGILQLKNKNNHYERLKVTCNDEPMIEVDYCNLHILLLCIINGFQYRPDVDLYLKCIPEDYQNKETRGLIKTAVNIMLNAKTSKSASDAIKELLDEKKNLHPELIPNCLVKGGDVMKWVYKGHPNLKEFFCNIESTGLVLQKMDSDMAHHVVHCFVSMEKPILVVHDSFLVRRSDKHDLIRSMVEAMKVVTERDDIKVPLEAEWFDKKSGYCSEKFII